MTVSPLAGKPPQPGTLVDVPKLITAYYTDVPDPSVPAQRVAFGTSGHRGSSFDTAFNEWHILAHDPSRLLRLLIQSRTSGAAHPGEQGPSRGRGGTGAHPAMGPFIRQPEVRPHAIFLSDYDMQLTERLVQGVDVWLNTLRRPWEACGTSGMKVLVNGGINLSELDGWWAEAYTPEVGWALGDGQEHGDDPAWDAAEAETLYDLLERR